jgi:amino acid transporter
MSDPLARPTLVRAISRFDLTAAVVNGVIGSAIFGMPGPQAALTGQWSPLGYVLAGLGMLTVVLCFAEVASRFKDTGGQYLYISEAFGPLLGFHAGWLFFWSRITALAANLSLLADSAARLAPALEGQGPRLALIGLVTLVLAAVNVAGVRQASWTINVFTVGKVLPLLLLIGLGLPQVRGEVLATQSVQHHQWTQAILLLVFAYGGFEAPLIAQGEGRDPRRDSGPSLFLGLGIVAAVYVLVQLVVVGVLPQAGGSRTAVADAFAVLLGPSGMMIASVGALVSTLGYSFGATLQAPRLLFAMGERRDLPSFLARIHERFRTPHAAIVTLAVVAFGLAAAGSFTVMAAFSGVVRLAVFAATSAALLVLRRRRPQEVPGFRLPAAAVIAPLSIVFCLWLLTAQTFAQARVLAGLVLLGALLRVIARREGGRPAV